MPTAAARPWVDINGRPCIDEAEGGAVMIFRKPAWLSPERWADIMERLDAFWLRLLEEHAREAAR